MADRNKLEEWMKAVDEMVGAKSAGAPPISLLPALARREDEKAIEAPVDVRLHKAARKLDIQTLYKLIFEEHIDPSFKNEDGKTAREVALDAKKEANMRGQWALGLRYERIAEVLQRYEGRFAEAQTATGAGMRQPKKIPA